MTRFDNGEYPEITEQNWKEVFRDEFSTFTKHGKWSGLMIKDGISEEEITDFIQSLITSIKQEERRKAAIDKWGLVDTLKTKVTIDKKNMESTLAYLEFHIQSLTEEDGKDNK